MQEGVRGWGEMLQGSSVPVFPSPSLDQFNIFISVLRSTDVPVNYILAKALVFKKVRKALGLDRCTKCFTGAAPIMKETLEYFLSLDIPVYELYGMSESSGPHTLSHPSCFKLTR